MFTEETLKKARTFGRVVVDIEGTTLTADDRRRITHPAAGAVILFTRNYASPEQLEALTTEIHALRPGVLIAVDHEGGRVQRFREGFTEAPAFEALRRGGPNAFRASGYVLAAELRAHGVDFTFGPVLDLDYGRSLVIGNRSPGGTVEEVVRNAGAFIDGLNAAGCASCGKHFPGHGWAIGDSHTELPVDERSREAIEADLALYAALAPKLDSVMTANVAYTAWEGRTATYCPELLGDVLRERTGFTGLVFSDDLSMKGAGDGRVVDRARRALDAGCDMVLHCNHPDELDEILEALERPADELFARRLARLLPAEPALTIDALRVDERYLSALAQLAAL